MGVRDGNTTDYYYFHLVLLLLNRPPSWPRFNYQHARLFQLCVDVVVVLPGEFQRRGPHIAYSRSSLTPGKYETHDSVERFAQRTEYMLTVCAAGWWCCLLVVDLWPEVVQCCLAIP